MRKGPLTSAPPDDVYKKSLAEKVAIAEKWISREYRAMLVLRIVGISRSTYYYQLSRKGSERHTGGGRPVPGYSCDAHGRQICDEQIKEWISELIEGEGYAYGYRKLTVCLHRKHGLVINKKKVYRLCKDLDVALTSFGKQTSSTATLPGRTGSSLSSQSWMFLPRFLIIS